MNNFEKIKSMNIDEMAELITFVARQDAIPYKLPVFRIKFDKDFDYAKDIVKQWLESEEQ